MAAKKAKTTTTTRTTTIAKKKGTRGGRLYPAGIPISPTGMALRDVKMPLEDARKLPLDAASARVAQQHHETMTRKGSGEKNVRWNASDARIRYIQCGIVYPHSIVSLRQVSPTQNDIPAVPIALEYDELIKHLREKYWRGEDAIFEWKAYDSMQPQLATGTIFFTEIPAKEAAAE